MAVKIDDAQLRDAFDALRNAGPRGRALAACLEERGTRARISSRLTGGFTLNFINTVFLQPLRAEADEFAFRQWVTLLAHEASHIEQRFWVDSVAQEIRAYQTQCRVAQELEIDLGTLREAFASLDPDAPQDQRTAQRVLTSLFFGTPAAIVYAALPLAQPRGVRAIVPACREILAVARASRVRSRA